MENQMSKKAVAQAEHFLVIVKDGEGYVLKFNGSETLSLLFILMDYAQDSAYNLNWDEVLFLIRNLCHEFLHGRKRKPHAFGRLRFIVF